MKISGEEKWALVILLVLLAAGALAIVWAYHSLPRCSNLHTVRTCVSVDGGGEECKWEARCH